MSFFAVCKNLTRFLGKTDSAEMVEKNQSKEMKMGGKRTIPEKMKVLHVLMFLFTILQINKNPLN